MMREMNNMPSTYGSSPYGDGNHHNETYERESNKKYSRKSSSFCFKSSEAKRKRRVAKYKAYGLEAKLKSSMKNGICWFKNKYYSLV
ncbi:hypothetical protein ACLB2K_039898 [Fragaria x ananassa]